MLHMLEHNLPGFGLDFGVVDGRVSIEIPETSIAAYRIDLPNDVELSIETQVHDQGRFSQYAKVINRSSTCVTFPYAFRANVSLNRASYGQLTEGQCLSEVFLLRHRDFLRVIYLTVANYAFSIL